MDILSIHNNLSVFVTLFAGEGQKIPQTLFGTRAPKTNGQSFIFHGLNPGAMVIFLLWRNLFPAINTKPCSEYIKAYSGLSPILFQPIHWVAPINFIPFFLKFNFVFQSTFKYNKNEN